MQDKEPFTDLQDLLVLDITVRRSTEASMELNGLLRPLENRDII